MIYHRPPDSYGQMSRVQHSVLSLKTRGLIRSAKTHAVQGAIELEAEFQRLQITWEQRWDLMGIFLGTLWEWVPSGFIKHGKLENPRTEWRF